MKYRLHVLLILILLLRINLVCQAQLPSLRVSENGRFLTTEKGDPFFWLGDTGWLLFKKLSREEVEKYFTDRAAKGFNVIQIMIIHDVKNNSNFYGDSALVNFQIDKPKTTPGSNFIDPGQYDYWDHVDYLADLAASKGLYLALVPVWGSFVKSGLVTKEQAEKYASWLADRYGKRTNIIWLNGGDIQGNVRNEIWETIGSVLHTNTKQLITFHPFGRTQSSTWFHNSPWLDFNMFQSGHRRYDQDTSGLKYGEDNWRYVKDDYLKNPVKPTLDGEPSYEGIPQGLHDPQEPYWKDNDVRRYAYWSVLSGGCGFTYGHSAIMQFYKESDNNPAYGVKITWDSALNAPGGSQMQWLKKLILSRPFSELKPAQDLLSGEPGTKYDYIVAARGKNYAYVYSYSGRTITLNQAKLAGKKSSFSWYNPGNGQTTKIGAFKNHSVPALTPPGRHAYGNDWVLIIESK